MKTSDMIQMGALAVVAFLAYEKFAKSAPKPSGGSPPPMQPSQQIPVDFGLANPNTWDDVQSISTLQNAVDWVWEGL